VNENFTNRTAAEALALESGEESGESMAEESEVGEGGGALERFV